MKRKYHRMCWGSIAVLLLLVQSVTPAASRFTVHGQVHVGKPVTARVSAGVSHAYRFEATTGDFVDFAYAPPGFATVLRIASAEGKEALLERRVSGLSGRREPLIWIAPRAGKFRVEVSSDEPGVPAVFQLEMRLKRRAAAEDEKRIAAQVEFERAGALDAQHDFKGALAAFERSLALSQQGGDRERQSAALVNMGLEYDKQNQPQQGINTFEKALGISREIHDLRGEVEALVNLVSDYITLNQREKVMVSLDQGLAAARAGKDQIGETRILTVYGNLNYGSDFVKAISYYEQALATARKANAHHSETALLHNLGAAKLSLESYQEAVEYLKQSLGLAQQRRDQPMIASSLTGLGYAYNNLNRFDDAIGCYERSLPMFRELKDKASESNTLNDLALAYANLNEFEKGIEYFQQALAIAREVHSPSLEGLALHNLAWSYDSLNQHAKAVPYYEQALVIARELKDTREEARLLMDSVQGIPELQHALSLLRETKDRQAEAWTLRILGDTYRKQRQFPEALQSASQSVAVAHEIKDPGSEAASLSVLMGICKDMGAPRLAVFYGKRAVNVVQSVRFDNRGLAPSLRESLVKGNAEMYHTLADLLIAEGRLSEAEQVLALLKDEEYFNFLRRDSDDSDVRTRKAGLTAEEEAYSKRFSEIQDHLVAIGLERGNLMAKPSLTPPEQQRLNTLDGDIAAGNAAFTKFLDDLRAHFEAGTAGARVQQLGEAGGMMEDLRELPAGTVAIYTLAAEDKFRAILVTPDVQKSYEYPITSGDLNRKVAEFRRVLQSPMLDPRPLAGELYSILLEKMEEDLRQAKARTLMWSLDGTLRYLPIAALYDGEKYVVEKYAVAEFTPVSNARLKDRPDHDWKAAGFGVTRAYEGAPALPAVASELNGIIARKPGEPGVLRGEVKLDGEFTQQAVKTTLQKRYQVVHIASHFNFQPGNETASFLLLGDGTHLSLATLKNMPSVFGGVQLLTLSACNTGMGGESGNGQEIEGFGRLAQDRGAKAVVASLWSVMDTSTSVLMQDFYRLRQGPPGLSKAAALREAQLMLLHGALKESPARSRGLIADPGDGPRFQVNDAAPYAHPYYWSGFFLMGNWL